jgi:hydroxymethylglutaryl-CoA reductase (NADPH)
VRLPWSHRNHPAAIRKRRAVLRQLPQFQPEDERIFPQPGDDRVLSQYLEAYVGQMVVPVGVVGPLRLTSGQYRVLDDGRLEEVQRQEDQVYLPLGHTEGGLSASMLRGLTAVNQGTGVHTVVLHDEMTRDTAWVFDRVEDALRFYQWIVAQEAALKEWIHDPANPGYQRLLSSGRTVISRHTRLLRIEPRLVGPVCHLLYRFHTGDACGPNMMTRNAYALNEEILRRLEATDLSPAHVYLESNMGGDKKPSWEYFNRGHGKTVLAWAWVPDRVIRHHLRVEPEDLCQLEWTGLHGAHASGMQSFAFTPASAVSAIFLVTGQDMGMVATSSMAQATVNRTDGGITFSLRFSGLEVGTVGGGTSLPHAQTYLRMMGCLKPGGAQRLAQIVAAAALCLDISASASMANRGSENFFAAHLHRGGERIH